MDYGTCIMPYGSAELHLQTVAVAEMARYYGIPSFGTAGCSDAKLFDEQAAMEATFNIATAALLVPIFLAMAAEFDLATAKLVMPVAIAASCAFMLPVASPPNAIIFGTGRVPQRTMIRVGFVLNLVFVALITAMSLLVF